MNKNKKLSLIAVTMLCTLFGVVGCGSNQEKSDIKESVLEDVEVSEEEEINEDGDLVEAFVRDLSDDEDNILIDQDQASVYFQGSKDGELGVHVYEAYGRINYMSLSIDGNGDEPEFRENIVHIIKKYCDESSIDSERILNTIGSLYKKISSDEYLNSKEAKAYVSQYGLAYVSECISECADVEVKLLDPNNSVENKLEISIRPIGK